MTSMQQKGNQILSELNEARIGRNEDEIKTDFTCGLSICYYLCIGAKSNILAALSSSGGFAAPHSCIVGRRIREAFATVDDWISR